MKMKGIILAGGTGSRMLPLTKAVNKHLLPIGDKPMLQHCVEKLTEAGIVDIMVVTGGEHLGGIAEFLGSGKDFKCNITYRVQDEPGGIAHALALAEGFVAKDERMCVILGDNIFEDSLKPYVYNFNLSQYNSMILLKQVSDPQRFGVATIDSGDVIRIKEKPKNPESDFAVTGIYFYDSKVFDIIKNCKPSKRGEMEITDVNNAYISTGWGGMCCEVLKGWWTDAGTHESYQRANQLYKELVNGSKNNNRK